MEIDWAVDEECRCLKRRGKSEGANGRKRRKEGRKKRKDETTKIKESARRQACLFYEWSGLQGIRKIQTTASNGRHFACSFPLCTPYNTTHLGRKEVWQPTVRGFSCRRQEQEAGPGVEAGGSQAFCPCLFCLFVLLCTVSCLVLTFFARLAYCLPKVSRCEMMRVRLFLSDFFSFCVAFLVFWDDLLACAFAFELRLLYGLKWMPARPALGWAGRSPTPRRPDIVLKKTSDRARGRFEYRPSVPSC